MLFFNRISLVLITASILGFPISGICQKSHPIDDSVYTAIEDIFSLHKEGEITSDQVTPLVDFLIKTPLKTGVKLKERDGSQGAFYTFEIKGTLETLIQYIYNPVLPSYLLIPTSVQDLRWLSSNTDQEVIALLRRGPQEKIAIIRGKEMETITPDTNTGGYYQYTQDRVLFLFAHTKGVVVVSVSLQSTPSTTGKKGCIAGADNDWNYLYSEKTGLNKTGLGWVDSYMYNANSLMIYVIDQDGSTIRIGNFKWLNAGWAKINMVNSEHILKGIQRFAETFKTILESHDLPKPDLLVTLHEELQNSHLDELRSQVSPLYRNLSESGALKSCPSRLRKDVSSGNYVRDMKNEELIRILMISALKEKLGRPFSTYQPAKETGDIFAQREDEERVR